MNLTALLWLLIGAFIGYAIWWILERFSWQDKRVCTEAEDQLRTQLQGVESRNQQLEASYTKYEADSVRLADIEGQLRAKDAELGSLQTNYEAKEKSFLDLDGRLKKIKGGDLSGIDTKGWDWGKMALAAGGGAALAGFVKKDSPEFTGLEAKIGKLESERDSLSKKVGSLEADLKSAKADVSGSADLEAKIKTLETERDNLSAKVGSLEADVKAAKADAGGNADLEARIAELEGERDGLNARLSSIDGGDLSSVDTEGWDLGKFGLAAGAGALAGYVASDDLDAVSAERDDLAARLAAMEADTSGSDLEARIATLEGERDGLQAQLDAAAGDTSLADLEAKYSTLEGERDGLNARIAELEKENKASAAAAAAAVMTAGGAGYFAGRDWRKLEVGSPSLGNFSIDNNDVATGKFSLAGTAEPNADVAVQVGETVIGRTRVSDKGEWNYSDVIKIPAGVHEVWARLVDTDDGRTAQEAKSRSIKLQRRAPAKPDDLTKLWGIGPKFNEFLQSKGITTFLQLSKTEVSDLRDIIAESKIRAALANEETWPEQAKLAANGDWDGLKKLTSDYAERRNAGEFADD